MSICFLTFFGFDLFQIIYHHTSLLLVRFTLFLVREENLTHPFNCLQKSEVTFGRLNSLTSTFSLSSSGEIFSFQRTMLKTCFILCASTPTSLTHGLVHKTPHSKLIVGFAVF